MIFYALTSAGPRKEVLKPEPESIRKALFHKNISSLENFGELARKFFFFCTYNGAEKHVTSERFENAAYRAKARRHEITFAIVHVTDDYVSFCDGPRILIRKTEKPCINSTWIALLIHGFVPV